MEKELSGTLIIFIVSGGVFMFIMLFIFGKRQIMRFTLRSRRGPHVAVGHDAGKSIQKEIERRLDCIQNITLDPQLLPDDSDYILQSDADLPPYYYRLRAVDDIKIIEKEIAKHESIIRKSHESIRAFLLTTLAAQLKDHDGQKLIHQFCDMYEHARHDPNEFGSEEYQTYERLLLKILDAAKSLKSYTSSRKTSPSRTPLKKQSKPSTLDLTQLNPPPAQLTEENTIGIDLSTNTRINYGISIQHPVENDETPSPRSSSSHLSVNAAICETSVDVNLS